jgi:ribonucleoside-diphosphate reductase alpha chain
LSTLYEFEYKDMEFSNDGQLDELIALDRYVVSAFDDYKLGDTVVAIIDKDMGTKRVGNIIDISQDIYVIEDRFGERHNIIKELLQKPLEKKPYQLWERWAKAGASVEKTPEMQHYWENEFRWLMDGYRYSLGGRIQLMLGQEYVTGEKANLTAYNCYVVRSPKHKSSSLDQFIEVMDVAQIEASIMRRGGGVGLNLSHISTVNGSGRKKEFFNFLLPETHPDYLELRDRQKLGKFDNVNIVTTKGNNTDTIDVDDSVEGHFNSINEMIQCAFDEYSSPIVIDFSNVRHRNAIVKGVNGRSSGAVSWMELFALVAELLQKDRVDNVEFAEIYSHIVHLIIQGGSRRGALMLICNDDNENVKKFIERKKTFGYLSGANISVGISDTFMQRVKDARNGSIGIEDINSLTLWDLIIQSAWESAEPGVIWLERYNKESNSWYFNPIVATNPCGEQGLPEFGVCNLGHYVLSRFYDDKTNDVKWDDLARAVRASVRLQDNIIDYTKYFLKENEDVQLKERRVGIGSLGLGTLLIKLGLRYGSDKTNKFINKLYSFIAYHQYNTSIETAEEKGAFPAFDYHKHIQSGFMKNLLEEFPDLQDKLKEYGIRNVTISTQAPTGSTGTYIDNIPLFRKLFGGTTTGIEPYFSWEYWRAGRLGVVKQTVDLANDYLRENGLTDIKNLPDYFVTAMDLKPEDHVKVQAAIQKWTDSSISKTANCPKDYTIEQTGELYMLSYDLGLKGMTIYRDGSREAQVLATNEEDAKLESHIEAQKLKEIKEKENQNVDIDPTVFTPNIPKRPKRLFGFTEKVNFMYGDNMGRAYVTINLNEGVPWEVFVSTKVKEVSSLAKALGLMTTKLLRLGGTSDNLQQAIDTLIYDQTMGTLPSAIANILKEVQKEKLQIEAQKSKSEIKLQKCPHCGKSAYDKGNCICLSCGVSKCN